MTSNFVVFLFTPECVLFFPVYTHTHCEHTHTLAHALSTAHLHCGFNWQGAGAKGTAIAGYYLWPRLAWFAGRAYKDNENNLTTLPTIHWSRGQTANESWLNKS